RGHVGHHHRDRGAAPVAGGQVDVEPGCHGRGARHQEDVAVGGLVHWMLAGQESHPTILPEPALCSLPVHRRTLRLGRREWPPGSFGIMAVINRTPDSFYDRTYELDAALTAADRAVRAGAGILDIGGVKAGPGDEVSVAEEIRRVVPLVAALRARHPSVVISVDTWRAPVGDAVAAAGADLLNDAWGGADPRLADRAAPHRLRLGFAHAGPAARGRARPAPRAAPARPPRPDGPGDRVADRGSRAGRGRGGVRRPDRHRSGVRLREEHLAFAGTDPADGGPGRHRVAGAGR